jgi:hypothetical protein
MYVGQILRQKVSMLQARLRQGRKECWGKNYDRHRWVRGEVQGYFFVVGPITLPPDSPINSRPLCPFDSANLTHPSPKNYIVSSLITHKISQDLIRSHKLLSLLASSRLREVWGLGASWSFDRVVRTCPLQTWEVVAKWLDGSQHNSAWPWFGQRDSALVEIHQKAEIRGLKAYCALPIAVCQSI